jgi:hypothetical protein
MSRRARVYLAWAVLAGLAALVYVLESREPEPYIAPEEKRRMFAFTEGEVGQIDLFFRGRLASLLRSPGGRWFQHDASHRHNPDSGAASPVPAGAPIPAGAVPVDSAEAHPEPDERQAQELAKIIDFNARMIFDRRITPTQPLKEYGLDNPQTVVIFYPRNADNSAGPAPLATLYVGAPLTHGQSYYAQLGGDRDIALIPLYQVNALTELAYGEVAQAPFRDPRLNPANRPPSQ